MKKILLITGLCAFLGLGMTGCNDDLDIPQHGVLNEDTYYQSDEEANEAITAVYADMKTLENTFFFAKNLMSDDVWAGTTNHSGDWWTLNDFNFDSSNEYIEAMFNDWYRIVGKCNVILDNVPETSDFQKQVRAEAKVFRAWSYFELTTMWGNIPLVNHMLESEEAALPNDDAATIWAFIQNDLTEAINSEKLVEKNGIDDNSCYRVTKQFAQALLGKALLWEGKYPEAAKMLDNVIDSNLYGLFESGDFKDYWSFRNDNNRESMFESNYVIDESNPGAMLRWYSMMVGLSSDAYPSTMVINPLNIYWVGWGLCVPTGDLYNAFVGEEGVDGYRLNQSIKTFEFLAQNGYKMATGQQMCSEGYFAWKIQTEKEAMGVGNFMDVATNIRWMRYSEVLLLAAEAHLMAGNQTKADQYLNDVRNRVHLPHKTATMEAIKLEKRLELCFEGVRYQDLQRWGDAATVLADKGSRTPVISSDGTVRWESYNREYGYKDKHKYLPIPASEIRVNKNIKQNPGW